jgi:hypothetical protein
MRSVCPFTTLAESATMAPCAFTTRVWVSSSNAASLFPPSLDTVIGTLTSTRWLRRRLDSVPPLFGSQVDIVTTLEQRAGNDNTMRAWNTQSVNCTDDRGESLHALLISGDPAGRRPLNRLRKKRNHCHSERRLCAKNLSWFFVLNQEGLIASLRMTTKRFFRNSLAAQVFFPKRISSISEQAMCPMVM